MRFSTRARYGLRVMFLIGIAQSDCVPLSMLVKQTDLSEKYLEQILGKLRRGGLVNANRGVNGGYLLARDKKEITINEILTALDDAFDLTDCVTVGCDDMGCPNKRIFKKIHDGINSLLDEMTLDDMINDNRCK